MIQELKQKCPQNGKIQVNFEARERLPNTASLYFSNVDGAKLLSKCHGKIEASRSAACHSGSKGGSGVLVKSGLTNQEANGTLRLSLGRYTSFEEIKKATDIIANAYNDCLKDCI